MKSIKGYQEKASKKQSRPKPKISIYKRSEGEIHRMKLSENGRPKVKRLIKKINLDDL